MKVTTADQRLHARRHARWKGRTQVEKRWTCPRCSATIPRDKRLAHEQEHAGD